MSWSNATVLPSFVDEKSLANRFCLFFIDKIKKIRHLQTHPIQVSSSRQGATNFQFLSRCSQRVLKFIKEAPSKTCSLDLCPTHIVKKCIDILLPSLTKLVNLSLKNGTFPNPLKQAIVTPLLKKSTFSKKDLKSYQPVSGLSFFVKVCRAYSGCPN